MRVKLLVGLEGFDIIDKQKPKITKLGEFRLRPINENDLKYIELIKDPYLSVLLNYIAETEYEQNEDYFYTTIERMFPGLKNKKYTISEEGDMIFIDYGEPNKIAIIKEAYLGQNRVLDFSKIIAYSIEYKSWPFITALHLYQAGHINPFPVVIKIIRADGIEVSPITLGVHVFSESETINYIVTKDKLNDFSKYIIKTIEALKKVEDRLPFNYFLSGTMYSELESSVIPFYDNRFALLNYIAGMESLFDISSELQYKLSLYVAATLGQNYEERKNYKDLISTLYNIRSNIAHGSGIKETEDDLDRLTQEAEEILRRLLNVYLHQYLAKGKTKKDFKNDAEAKILGKTI